MNTWIFLLTLVFFGIITSITASAAPVVQVTVHVEDEDGQALPGATIELTLIQSPPESVGAGTRVLKGQSDGAGNYIGSGESEWVGVSVVAHKEGYYASGDTVPMDTVNAALNRWEPWDPTVTLRLKKIRNPVPMYYKRTDWMKVPAFDSLLGYDLEQGDWVRPYGKGKTSHFVFIVHQTQEPTGATYTLSFSHPGDGIQPYVFDPQEQSSFKWPFEAPEDGYAATMNREKVYYINGQPETNLKKDEDINYIFRVHTLDEQRNIVSVMYGKIEGEITLNTKGGLKFSYYLNPDGTGNLEEDSRRNLFDDVRPQPQTPQEYLRELGIIE